MRKIILFLLFLVFALVPLAHADPSLDEIIANIQANQALIKDMSADTITTITSTMKGAKDMTQKGKILMKYPDKSRVEVFSPVHQVTINNGEKIIIINKDTGQKFEQDLSEAMGPQGSSNGGQMDFDKAKEYFDFTVRQEGGNYVITGAPKTDNKFLGKMEFVVDPDRSLTTKVKVYNPQGKLISESAMDHAQIKGRWVMSKIISNVATPMGNMKMEMEYQNIKVNQGIGDGEFR